jgi:hypothetical protein
MGARREFCGSSFVSAANKGKGKDAKMCVELGPILFVGNC